MTAQAVAHKPLRSSPNMRNGSDPMQYITMLSTVVVISFAMSSTSASAQTVSDETPLEIVAAQVRKQGFKCEHPPLVTRDHERSGPNRTVWVLTCANATYRVTLVPDQGAQVEVLAQ